MSVTVRMVGFSRIIMHEALSSQISVAAFEDVQNLSIDHVNTRLLDQLFAVTNRPTKATDQFGIKD